MELANLPTKYEIRKWCKALRSGKYKQASANLESQYGFCCLGVACKIFSPDHPTNSQGYLSGSLPSSGYMNDPRWLAEVDQNFQTLQKMGGEMEPINLPQMNDSLGASFDEIADMLELVFIHQAYQKIDIKGRRPKE